MKSKAPYLALAFVIALWTIAATVTFDNSTFEISRPSSFFHVNTTNNAQIVFAPGPGTSSNSIQGVIASGAPGTNLAHYGVTMNNGSLTVASSMTNAGNVYWQGNVFGGNASVSGILFLRAASALLGTVVSTNGLQTVDGLFSFLVNSNNVAAGLVSREIATNIVNALAAGGIDFAVEEEDGTPSVTGITEINFPNGSVTDNGGGSVSVSIAGGGASQYDFDANQFNTNGNHVTIKSGSLTTNLGLRGATLTGTLVSSGAIISTVAGGYVALGYVTPSRAAMFNSAGMLTNSIVTETELGYVSGVTSGIQAQIDALAGGGIATSGGKGTNNTFTHVSFDGSLTFLTNSPSTSVITDTEGMHQIIDLDGNTNFTGNISAGQTVLLEVVRGGAFIFSFNGVDKPIAANDGESCFFHVFETNDGATNCTRVPGFDLDAAVAGEVLQYDGNGNVIATNAPTITSMANATHDHEDAAGGGALPWRFNSIAVADLGDAATPSVLTTAESENKLISNYQSSGADHVFTMPAAHARGNVTFVVGDEFQVDIEPNSSDNFYLNGTAMATDEHIQNTADTLGDTIVGVAVNLNGTYKWMFHSDNANWVEATP